MVSDGFFLRAESFYNSATYLGKIGATRFGDKSLHAQSHGESFLSTVQNRFTEKGLYILDEPESALSPMRIMTLLVEINRLVSLGSQFIISTHSPILTAYPNADILQLTSNGIKHVKYTETEHYIVTKEFLNHTDKMLDILLK